MKPEKKIAVLVKRFPKLSETFILNELLALEDAGLMLAIFHLYPPSDDIVHADVARLRAPVAPIGAASPGAGAARFFRRPFRTVRAFIQSLAAFRGDWRAGWRDALGFARQVEDTGADLIYAHFIDRPAAVAKIASRLSGVPYAVSAHAKDIYTTAPRALARHMRGAVAVTTCSEHNAAYLRSIAPNAEVVRNYHGVAPEKFAGPPKPSSSASAPLILSVGRLRAKKGLDTLISACALLHNRGAVFRCEIIGYGPDEAALRSLINDNDLGGLVELLGKRPHGEVVAKMAAAQAFALPCRIDGDGDRDGVPNVVLEAMASGLPVVSTRVSGVPEAVVDGETGFLVNPDDPRALADALARLIADAETARYFGDRARVRVSEKFSHQTTQPRLVELIRNAAGGARGEVAYVLKGFPRLSESFITNEILLLEAQGLPIRIFALKKGDAIAAGAIGALKSEVFYLPPMTSLSATPLAPWLWRNMGAYLPAMARVFARRPAAFVKTFAAAVSMTRRYRSDTTQRPRKAFIKEFMQAAFIADGVLAAPGVRHLHGHFCHGATTVTWFASRLSGVAYSFTAHAKDIYQKELNPGDLLQCKIDAAKFVVTCTGANRSHLVGAHGEQTCRRLHTIYHGLDVSKFVPPPRPANYDDPPRILAVGRHVAKKGFATLLEACAALKTRGVAFHCEIVGEEGDATPLLRDMIGRSGLTGDVTLTPPVAQDALAAIYARATLFALPCTVLDNGDRDGIPNVLAEAMATALPAVTTPVSGIPEIVEDGVNGLFAPPNDAVALAAAIEKLIADPALRARLGARARATILEKFDSSKTTRRLHALLRESPLLEAAE